MRHEGGIVNADVIEGCAIADRAVHGNARGGQGASPGERTTI
jgi:hypothetical protein